MKGDDYEVRLAVLETQLGRIVSDLTSEKATRARTNSEILAQLRAIEMAQRRTDRIIWMGLGGLSVFQFFVAFVMPP